MATYITRAAQQCMRQRAGRLMSSAAGEHTPNPDLWKKLTFFVAFPSIGLGMVNAYLAHKEESHERPEFKPYEFRNIRTKRFPWGDGNHSLFHNPRVNALPTGYED